MAEFLLLHGAWHGAWCWRDVAARLREFSHEATAIDLPGHGEDTMPRETITLQDYVQRIDDALAILERPIIVGHSAGGVISQVAESVPDSIRALVYISALLPPDGVSMIDIVTALDPEYLAEFQWSADRRTASISRNGAERFLYSGCTPEAVERAYPNLTPEPVAPFETPVRLTETNFGKSTRFYIECLRDRVIPIKLQRSMRLAFSFEGVYTLDSDHFPQLSAPDELARVLNDIAEKVCGNVPGPGATAL